MIIVDELPFKHVEKADFKHFVQVACPRFHIPARTTIARDVREAKGMSGVDVEEIEKEYSAFKCGQNILHIWMKQGIRLNHR
ncbi:hypothetical protein BVRB_6g153690 [Beta vulgaris subsp. vulgaris]|nr:hypothetical protein BVRB_6g153690 [Beta vulgaris subsp. vulgaris]